MEKGEEVSGHDINGGTQCLCVSHEGSVGLGGGDGAGVAYLADGGADVVDEVREGGRGGVVVEEGFVADDDEVDEGEVRGGLRHEVYD